MYFATGYLSQSICGITLSSSLEQISHRQYTKHKNEESGLIKCYVHPKIFELTIEAIQEGSLVQLVNTKCTNLYKNYLPLRGNCL